MDQLVSQKSKKINDSENNSSGQSMEKPTMESIGDYYQEMFQKCKYHSEPGLEKWVNSRTGKPDKDYSIYRMLFDEILKDSKLEFEVKSLYLRNLENYFNINSKQNRHMVR